MIRCPLCGEEVEEEDYSAEHDMCLDCLVGAQETAEDPTWDLSWWFLC